MCTDSVQTLCHFTWGTWAPADFGVQGGTENDCASYNLLAATLLWYSWKKCVCSNFNFSHGHLPVVCCCMETQDADLCFVPVSRAAFPRMMDWVQVPLIMGLISCSVPTGHHILGRDSCSPLVLVPLLGNPWQYFSAWDLGMLHRDNKRSRHNLCEWIHRMVLCKSPVIVMPSARWLREQALSRGCPLSHCYWALFFFSGFWAN
jgi:hypothetical protein